MRARLPACVTYKCRCFQPFIDIDIHIVWGAVCYMYFANIHELCCLFGVKPSPLPMRTNLNCHWTLFLRVQFRMIIGSGYGLASNRRHHGNLHHGNSGVAVIMGIHVFRDKIWTHSCHIYMFANAKGDRKRHLKGGYYIKARSSRSSFIPFIDWSSDIMADVIYARMCSCSHDLLCDVVSGHINVK